MVGIFGVSTTKEIYMPLPDAYVDCVIKRADGQIRIGRLNHNKTHWQLASYQDRKVYVVWSIDDVTEWEEINTTFINGPIMNQQSISSNHINI